MKKFLQKKLNNEKGMTLIELLAVIVIIAIIAAIAIPAIGGIIENSRYSAVKSDALNAISSANIYFAETPTDTSITVDELKAGKFLDNIGKLQGTETITKTATGSITIKTVDAGGVVYSGAKKVIFNNSTTTTITGDTVKGSTDGDKTIN